MHGIDVVFSSYYTAKIRQKLINFDINSAKSNFDRENWQKEIHRVYTSSAEGVIALQDKMGWYNEDRYERYKEIWSDIVSLLGEAPSPEETEKMLEDIGLDIADFEKMYGKSKIEDAILYAKDLKDRYSVLWLNYDIAR
jgi:glycerol-1-phosphate dehydrogenase [NAD(P)+]